MKMNESHASQPSDEAPRATKKKAHPFWRLVWLAFLGASLSYAWHSFYVPSNDVDWADDIASARQSASTSGKPVLMFFTADWCSPCRVMKREVFADPEVTTKINANMVPVMIYAGDPGADVAAKRYNVRGTPISIITDPQGEVINYAVGGIGKSGFLELLDKSLGAGPQNAP